MTQNAVDKNRASLLPFSEKSSYKLYLKFFFLIFLMQAVLRITKTYATHIALHMYQLEVLITLAVCMVQLNKLITH